MKKVSNLKRLDRQSLQKIKGGGYSLAPACTLAGEVKCSRTIPCPVGCSCYGNRCAPDDVIAAK